MLINVLIFVAVLLVFFAFSWMYSGRRIQMQKDIERLQSRLQKKPAATAVDLSLKRRTSQEKGLLSLLAKPLPTFAKLGD